jgi:hypothetical protein
MTEWQDRSVAAMGDGSEAWNGGGRAHCGEGKVCRDIAISSTQKLLTGKETPLDPNSCLK